MNLEITKEFIEFTDLLIKQHKEQGLVQECGNILVAKLNPAEKVGSLVMDVNHLEREAYKIAIARIIAVPRLMLPEQGDPELKIGDYIVFTHEARYVIHPAVLCMLFDANAMPDKTLVTVKDSEVLLTVPASSLHKRLSV